MIKLVEFVKKYDTILFILGLIITGLLLLGITKGYCANVTDDNKGNKGYILINNGEGKGHEGTWTDIKTIPELKGEKGEKGDTGEQGIQGLKGDKGDLGNKGDTGKEGYTPIKNIDYFDGLNGLNGKDGKDVDPKEVKRIDNKNLEQDNKINDLDNRIEKLERTQYVLETSFRIVDTKRISLRPFFRQNFTRNKVDVVGLKIDVKLGQSYEEKLIKKVNARLDLLEQIIGNAPVIEKIIDKKGNIKSINIIANGLDIKGKF